MATTFAHYAPGTGRATIRPERRTFLAIGFEQPSTLASSLVKIARGATLFHFGGLTPTMHNARLRAVCGRLESRYRYSVSIVYTTSPGRRWLVRLLRNLTYRETRAFP